MSHACCVRVRSAALPGQPGRGPRRMRLFPQDSIAFDTPTGERLFLALQSRGLELRSLDSGGSGVRRMSLMPNAPCILLIKLSLAAGLGIAASAAPPNVVFFLADDLGWRDLGCYGSQFYETPSIDGLAASGARFTQAYAACPVCSPTRASIMTGKYPVRNRVDGLYQPLRRKPA